MEIDFYQIAQTYFRGTVTAEDEVRLSAFLKESEANRALFRQWENEWKQIAKAEASAKTQAAWAKMRQQMYDEYKAKPSNPIIVNRKLSNRKWYYAAAAVALLLFGCALWLFIPSIPDAPFIAQTAAHETQTVTLPDGTEVTLNSLSYLACADDFNKTDRRITFEGEAVFNVIQDTERQFIINVGDYNVTVLGTHFNLSAYPHDGNYTLALISGSVKVKYLQDSVIVHPDEQVRFDLQTETFTVQPYKAMMAAAWVNNRIEGNMSLHDLARKLERLYDVDIAFADTALAQETVYISLSDEESFLDVCEAIETLLPVRIEQTDNHYLISAQ